MKKFFKRGVSAMFRCRIYQTKDNQAPKDYTQVWDNVGDNTEVPKNAKLMLALEDHTKESIERVVEKYLEHITLNYYALGKSAC